MDSLSHGVSTDEATASSASGAFPLPFVYDEAYPFNVYCSDAVGVIVATCAFKPDFRGSALITDAAQAEAARFIVTACNAHHDLIAALTDALWAIDNMSAMLNAAQLESTLTDPREAIRAALDKAEKGSGL